MQAKQWEKLSSVHSTVANCEQRSWQSAAGRGQRSCSDYRETKLGGVSQEMQIALITLGIKRCDIYCCLSAFLSFLSTSLFLSLLR